MVFGGSSVNHLVCAMRMTQLSIVIALGACAMIVAGILGPAPWLARESIFEFTARQPRNRNPAQLTAPPNDGPATPPNNWEVTEGPLPVS